MCFHMDVGERYYSSCEVSLLGSWARRRHRSNSQISRGLPRSGGTTEHRDEGPRHLGRLATGIRMRGWENQLMVDKSRDQRRSGRWRPKTNKHMPLTKRRLSPVSASLQRAGAEIFCILPTLVFPIRRSYNIAPLQTCHPLPLPLLSLPTYTRSRPPHLLARFALSPLLSAYSLLSDPCMPSR